MNANRNELEKVFAQAECLYTQLEVEKALDRVARQITADLSGRYPLILGVLQGSMATLGYLLPRLPFLLDVDYLQASHCRGTLESHDLLWTRHPDIPLHGRHILLIDDILNRGLTLATIAQYCHEAGAADVKIAVLSEKRPSKFTAAVEPDYVALQVPDRYVFGYGLDYEDHWRNAPGIYARA